MAAAPTGDTGAVTTPEPDASASPRFAGRRWLLAASGALVVVLIVACVVLAFAWKSMDDRDSLTDQGANAKAVAEQLALTMDSVDPTNLNGLKAAVEPFLTTKAKAEFGQQFDQMTQFYAQLQQEAQASGAASPSASASPRAGTIKYAAVSDLTSDAATVLVAHGATVPGTTKQIGWRWEVRLLKVQGKWLVDSIVPVQ